MRTVDKIMNTFLFLGISKSNNTSEKCHFTKTRKTFNKNHGSTFNRGEFQRNIDYKYGKNIIKWNWWATIQWCWRYTIKRHRTTIGS